MCWHYATSIRCRRCNYLIDLEFSDEYCDVYKNNKLATCKRSPIYRLKRVGSSRCKICKPKEPVVL
jgi:hypothetical protein